MLIRRRARTLLSMLAAVALAGCSQSASPGVAATNGSGATQPAPKGPDMSDDDKAAIVKYYEEAGWGKPESIVPAKAVPGMYHVENTTRLVVQRGKIVDGGGLDAARAYMRDAKLIEHKPEAQELVILLAAFTALPPIADGAEPEQYYDAPKFPKLNPKAQWSADGGTLVVHYLLPFPSGGSMPNPNLRRLLRWTLSISKDYKLAWRDEETTFDIATQEIGGS